jgi:hypothetical protein
MAHRYYNFNGHRIGDKVAGAFMVSERVQEHDDEFVLIDPTWDRVDSFPIKQFFPQISNFVFETNTPEKAEKLLEEKGFDKLHTGNLWVSAPSLVKDYAEKGVDMYPTMYIPKYIKDFVKSIDATPEDGRPTKKLTDFELVIINHCLSNPPYNPNRRHDPIQWVGLMKRINQYMQDNKIDGVMVDVPNYQWSFSHVIGLISTADIFIGGDTGCTHVAGALKKDIVAVYGNSDHDVKAFHVDGMSSEWCSDPLSKTYTKFVMENNKFNEDEVFNHVVSKINEKLESKIKV